jgi:ankyrin repeat protein
MLFLINKEGCTPLCITINQNQDNKALALIQKMQKYSTQKQLKYVRQPNRLDMKYEKPFVLAVLKNNINVIRGFPDKSIKTTYVNMSQVKDYKMYEQEKDENPDIITTPLHIACRLSNDEAVRQLVDQHNYDINILLNEKSALFELLSTSKYLDFSILNFLIKRKKPCVNSGVKLPLNQAILRGNPFIINSIIEFAKPHPLIRDQTGKPPIHFAALKLDVDTFDALISRCGANPMQPDTDGNTILHIMALGVIRDAEFDFIKQSI